MKHAQHQSMSKSMAKAHGPSPAKAKEILRHGEVHGHALTPKQQRFMGARAGKAR